VHSREGFRWEGAVHEVLVCEGEYEFADAQDVKLDHWPDESKSRAQYLPLLETAVAEDPQNDRNTHYLGREYMFRGEYAKAIGMLKRHLSLPGATWRDERCASMRYIARCYAACAEAEESEEWLFRAAAEAPWLREPWTDLARHAYIKQDWAAVLFACERALKISERPKSYISEPECWGETPYDLLAIANYHLGRMHAALDAAKKAEEMAPDSGRIHENREILERICAGT